MRILISLDPVIVKNGRDVTQQLEDFPSLYEVLDLIPNIGEEIKREIGLKRYADCFSEKKQNIMSNWFFCVCV